LKILDLSENQIDDIHEKAFNDLKSLNDLDLKKNQIKIIPKELFKNLKELIQLHLSLNNIETIDSATFKDLLELKEIYLNNEHPSFLVLFLYCLTATCNILFKINFLCYTTCVLWRVRMHFR
jgi:Leucine-rich repeat (LRR) protein